MKSKSLVSFALYLLFVLVGIIAILLHPTILVFALVALLQLASSLIYAKAMGKRIISIFGLFIICSFVFNCGQLLNVGFGIDGYNHLAFYSYGNASSQLLAFLFYYLSQAIITISACLHCQSTGLRVALKQKRFVDLRTAIVLLIIGIVPRVYCDLEYLRYGLSFGYQGTSAVYIPQIIDSLAFFADLALLLFLYLFKGKRATILFVAVVFYKGFMMLSGNRQQSFVFLIIWAFMIFFVKRETSVKTIIISVIIGYLGLVLIMTIGDLRTTEFKSMNAVFDCFFENFKGRFFGDLFGEFGCSFSTLVKTVNDTPSCVGYGFGKSYLAGALSVVPALVKNLGSLGDSMAYITQYDNVSSFGGSFLGELYYNFAWFGLVPCVLIGRLLAKIDSWYGELKITHSLCFENVLGFALSIAILLFIRGYFADMIQKMFWSLAVAYVLSKPRMEKVFRNGGIQCNRSRVQL